MSKRRRRNQYKAPRPSHQTAHREKTHLHGNLLAANAAHDATVMTAVSGALIQDAPRGKENEQTLITT